MAERERIDARLEAEAKRARDAGRSN